MKTIRILGGGISGLTAAINLKIAGFDIEVHERKSNCGKNTNDFQFLENWTLDEDVLHYLPQLNIRTDFYVKPWYLQEFLSPSFNRYVGKSVEPVMYLVKRGSMEDSIDRSLENQAIVNKIKIFYNSTLKHHEADVIATGFRKPTFIATGIRFRLKRPDRSIVLFDKNLSLQFYSYFILNDDVGLIVCVNPVTIRNHQARLKLTLRAFEQILSAKIEEIQERFSAVVNFSPVSRAKIGSKYFVGEAAGFQDYLAGFGMTYAFKSGFYAARSIIENTDYDNLWKRDFHTQLKIGSSNRFLYEKLSNKHYEKVISFYKSENPLARKLRGGDDLTQILRRIYKNPVSYLIHPFI